LTITSEDGRPELEFLWRDFIRPRSPVRDECFKHYSLKTLPYAPGCYVMSGVFISAATRTLQDIFTHEESITLGLPGLALMLAGTALFMVAAIRGTNWKAPRWNQSRLPVNENPPREDDIGAQ
jgi:hypothetical protein